MEVFARRMQHHVTWPTSLCRRHLRTVAARLTVQSPGHSRCPGTRTSTGQRSFAAYGPGPGTDYQRQLWVSCTIFQSCCDCTASSASTTNVQTRLDSTRLDALPAKKIYGQVLKLELPNVQCTCYVLRASACCEVYSNDMDEEKEKDLFNLYYVHYCMSILSVNHALDLRKFNCIQKHHITVLSALFLLTGRKEFELLCSRCSIAQPCKRFHGCV